MNNDERERYYHKVINKFGIMQGDSCVIRLLRQMADTADKGEKGEK